MVYRLVLLRHAESLGNKEDRITGWNDVDLSERGVAEAREAGRTLKEAGFTFDVAYTSLLRRAIKTVWFVLDEMDLNWIPIVKTWRLNERHFGIIEGMRKTELAEKYPVGSATSWRRRNSVSPPKLNKDDPRYLRDDPRYSHLKEDEFPNGESRHDMVRRVEPYWQETIIPEIQSGKKVLIVSHGDLIRTLAMVIAHANIEEATSIGVIPTATAIIYKLDSQMNPVKQEYLSRPSIAPK
jgi:2,3-bisphosphoglycerate-dependent phosphoglycerate mutase